MNVFPGLDWIVPYFVISTFPTIFGHFLSEEYLDAGLRFIEGHIADPLAPKLVGIFLLHCFLFRDRLMEVFYDQLCAQPPDTEFMGAILLDAFKQAFVFCVPYFSEAHIRAVQTLRAHDLKGAIKAVFKDFLGETVKLWQFSPLLRGTDTILHRPANAQFQSYESMKYEFLLLGELRRLDQAQCVAYLDCLNDNRTTTMPKMSEIAFCDGVKLPLSVVDLVLVLHLNELLQSLNGRTAKSKPVSGSVVTAAADAFRLHGNIVHYLSSKLTEPVATETSQFLTRKRLEEHKALHNFLFGIAGGIRQLHTIRTAERNIWSLLHRSLSSRLFLSKTITQIAEFANLQRRRYAMSVFDEWVRYQFRGYVEAATEGDFVEVHERALQQRINRCIAQKVDVSQAIINATVDYVNDWKQRFKKDHPNALPQRLCQAAQENIDECQYFNDATGEMLFAMMMNQLSCLPFPIVLDRVKGLEARREHMKRNLQSVSVGPLFAGIDIQRARATLDEAFIMSCDHIKFLLRRAAVAIRAAFENDDIRFGSGDQFMLFLEIESFIGPLMASQGQDDPTWGRRFLCVMFDGEEPFYFRACLGKALQSFVLLTEKRNGLFLNIADIGNPIDRKIAGRFRNLCEWFRLKPDLIPV
jgi:hypothetical protein